MDEVDRTAVRLAREGDVEAFRVLVDRHSRYLYQVAYRLTGHALDAEDAVQETFLRAFRQLSQFQERADLRTWLHRITRNCAIDLIRARRTRETAVDAADLERQGDGGEERGPWPDQVVHGLQIKRRIQDTLAALTTLERAAFTLRHLEGLSIREISLALEVKPQAAKHSVFRAVRKVRAALQPFVEAPAKVNATEPSAVMSAERAESQ